MLQPGETDAVQWASFERVEQMVAQKEICAIIGRQFTRQAPLLKKRQIAQD